MEREEKIESDASSLIKLMKLLAMATHFSDCQGNFSYSKIGSNHWYVCAGTFLSLPINITGGLDINTSGLSNVTHQINNYHFTSCFRFASAWSIGLKHRLVGNENWKMDERIYMFSTHVIGSMHRANAPSSISLCLNWNCTIKIFFLYFLYRGKKTKKSHFDSFIIVRFYSMMIFNQWFDGNNSAKKLKTHSGFSIAFALFHFPWFIWIWNDTYKCTLPSTTTNKFAVHHQCKKSIRIHIYSEGERERKKSAESTIKPIVQVQAILYWSKNGKDNLISTRIVCLFFFLLKL